MWGASKRENLQVRMMLYKQKWAHITRINWLLKDLGPSTPTSDALNLKASTRHMNPSTTSVQFLYQSFALLKVTISEDLLGRLCGSVG